MYNIEDKEILLNDPRKFGLTPRTVLGQCSTNHWVLIKDRKSRIIMNDGKKVLEQINEIRKFLPNSKISLATTAPVCSKTTILLKSKGIDVLALKKLK